MEISRKAYSYSSTTGVAKIYARRWAPADPSAVKGVFQIAHGMAEHGERYEDFARFLCENGYAVFINDHVGHGKSINDESDLGYFGERDGWHGLVSDAKLLTDIAKREFPDKPLIFFGHSMGSFVARSYVEKHGADLAAAVFMGTSGVNPGAGPGILLASFIAKARGSHYRSEFINKIAFGSYLKRIEDKRTPFDWLSRDEAQVDKYIADPLCGFLFTAKGYKDMFTILKSVSGKSWYEGVPTNLPILLISGDADPVGEYGAGVKQVHRDLKKSGHIDVVLRLYKDARHELLNETNKDEVYDDILKWADRLLMNNKIK